MKRQIHRLLFQKLQYDWLKLIMKMNSMDIEKVKEHFNDRKDDYLTQQVNINIHFFRRSFSFLVANSRWYRLLRRNICWNFDTLSKCDQLSFGWWPSSTFDNFLRFNINKSNFNSSSFIIIIVNSSRFEIISWTTIHTNWKFFLYCIKTVDDLCHSVQRISTVLD